MLVAHVTEATGSHCLQGGMGEKEGRREAGDKCVVWANCCLVDIKSSVMVGVVCAEENTTWSEQPLQIGVGGQLYQLSSEYQHHPKCVPPPPHISPPPPIKSRVKSVTAARSTPYTLVCTAIWDKLEISRIVKN